MSFRENSTQGILVAPAVGFEQELVSAPAPGKIRFTINYILSANIGIGAQILLRTFKKKAGTLYFLRSDFTYNGKPFADTLPGRIYLVNSDESFVFVVGGNVASLDMSFNISWGEID